MPLITGGQRPVVADDTNTLAALASAEFDPRRVVYMGEAAREAVRDLREGKVAIQPGSFQAQRVEFAVQAEASAVVVVAQSFYPAWKAEIDGRSVPMWRANHAFQAVIVPAGTSHVRLVYEDRALKLGAILSALTLLIGLVAWRKLLWAREEAE